MGRAAPARVLTDWLRAYPLAPSYRAAEVLRLEAADGVRLSATRLPGPAGARAGVVLVHGFANSSRNPRIHAFAHHLARSVEVVVPDLRGHRRSGGRCTYGRDEHLDVAAAVDAVTPGLPVVTVGVSLGGAAALLHAAAHGGSHCHRLAAVVAVSAPARWGRLSTAPVSRIRRTVGGPVGRLFLAAALNTRVAVPGGGRAADPEQLVHAAAPARVVVVHSRDDHFFDAEHAERLYDQASEPRELWWHGSGHGVDLLTTDLADRLVELVARSVSGAEPPRS